MFLEDILKEGRVNWICLRDGCPNVCCNRSQYHRTPLLSIDVERIKKAGVEHGIEKGRDEMFFFKKKEGNTCLFHDGEKCEIYENRAASCRAYPFLFDKRAGLIVDDSCPGIGKGWTEMSKVKEMVSHLCDIYEHHVKITKEKHEL